MEYEGLGAVLCGKCLTPVDVHPSGGEATVRCPICGENETLQVAQREARQHTAYRLIQRALTGLTEPKPDLSFRFIERAGPRHRG
jgi:uncharacterized Zn finger protein (UPF0148 family)